MTPTPLSPSALAALAKDAGFAFDAERLEAVAATLAFIRAEIARLDRLDLADTGAHPFNPDWS
ncbi:hypothetical protein [Chromobacterium aquaticum]|uniref:Uncharacterized protein n=1 Tax=Chromobacterium aquaticum TaxID=467180 RepID=A0ABV8ZRC8_9NEIS|nr:hypothetical protein [Chromobacterium aquaticum]MCD5362368.1 hypothetical protein [Chromobacterium aquaticum]